MIAFYLGVCDGAPFSKGNGTMRFTVVTSGENNSVFTFVFSHFVQGNIALFEACCKERIQQFDDGGSDEEDIWEEKHIAFAPESQRRSR